MKPMLAATLEDFSMLKFPVIVQPKLDGIRALIVDGVVMSRTLKPIPNKYIQEKLRFIGNHLGNFDGELLVGNPVDPAVFKKTMEGVMSAEGEPDFSYIVFDKWDRGYSYEMFYASVHQGRFPTIANVRHIESYTVNSIEEYLEYEDLFVRQGYEGIMIRGLDSQYKFGRSTLKEGYLLKAKRFMDTEAVVIGFEELMRNQNEKITNALGHAERSTKKEGLVPAGMLGRLVCQMSDGTEFGIGSGFDVATRQEIWDNREKYSGQLVTFKYQGIGSKGAPRFPIFKGFRDWVDAEFAALGGYDSDIERLLG